MSLRIDSRAMTALFVAALTALALPAVTEAKKRKDPTVTVMTRNLFLGADLSPAIGAATIPQAIDGAGQIWNELQSTKFAERAVPLAREIKRSKADLVGLQEVALWHKQTPSDGGSPPISPIRRTPATAVELDFLAILRRELNRIGAKYRVVVVQKEFEAELPVDADGSDATGRPSPSRRRLRRAADDARRDPRQEDEQAEARQDPQGQLRHPLRAERGRPPHPGRSRLGVGRGAAQEARAKFRFVDTHLEAFGDPAIREAQAKELTEGPLDTRKQVILVGDLNSGIARHNEPEQPGDDLAFKALAAFGMHDNGAVQSCCYPSLFDPAGVFDHTVDHVLTKPRLATVRARVTGDDPQQRTPSGLWPSDHGGVVSTLKLKK